MTPSTPTSAVPLPRFNPWPYGLVLALAGFVAGIATLVVVATRSGRPDLVTPDYYEQELHFQGRLDARRRAQPLEGDIRVAPQADMKAVAIQLPAVQAQAGVKGEVVFYRPSASGSDRRFPMVLGPGAVQQIGVTGFEAGLWRVQLSWDCGGQAYFVERDIVLSRAAH